MNAGQLVLHSFGKGVDAGAKIYQNSSTNTTGTSAANTAEVTQWSNTHGALVIQGGIKGSSNEAYVTQGGTGLDTSNNTAFVGQDTSLLAANNIATINQNTTTNGGSNLAMVYQH